MLSLVGTLSLMVVSCIMYFYGLWMEKTNGLPVDEMMQSDYALAFFFILTLALALLIIFVMMGYECFGIVEIYSDKLVFRAVFHKTRIFLLSEICDVGIDYGVISGIKQFWIYFSKEKVDSRYVHNILRLPYSCTTMRVQYSKKVYDALMQDICCDKIRNKLIKSQSIISFYNVKA